MMNRKQYIEDPALQVQERILQKLFGPGDALVIFDIGACEGESSIRYSRMFPRSVIHAFEPLPGNLDWIRKNIEHYAAYNIRPHAYCLSDKAGEVSFYVSAGKPEGVEACDWDYGNKSSSILPPGEQQTEWLQFKDQVTVPASTLKQFCAEQEIAAIDFIHMDVQGAELMVLDGAGDFIRYIRAIWLEVEAVELYKGQPLKKDVEAYMQQHGFIKIADTVYDTAGDQFWVNAEFIRSKKDMPFVWYTQAVSTLRKVYKQTRRRLIRAISAR